MPNPFRRSVPSSAGPLVPALLLCLVSLTAHRAIAQDTTSPAAPMTALARQLSRIDFAISGAGMLSSHVSGTEKRDNIGLAITPSNTFGELVTLRYTRKPLVGFELNFANSRSNQKFVFANTVPNFSAQTGVREFSLGYVAHTPTLFGVQPFLGAGGGTMRFQPTPYGGQGLPNQYRAVYFYEAGVDDLFPTSHFGVRLGFRQLIYLAPDFGQNYLTILRRTITSEPTIGVFLRF